MKGWCFTLYKKYYDNFKRYLEWYLFEQSLDIINCQKMAKTTYQTMGFSYINEIDFKVWEAKRLMGL